MSGIFDDFSPNTIRIEKIKQSIYYHQIYKPFKRVEGYCCFSDVAISLSDLMLAVTFFTLEGNTEWSKDVTTMSIVALTQEIMEAEMPVYWLNKDLMQTFLETDISPSVIDYKKFNHAIIMLPPLIQNPDGFDLKWVIIKYLERGHITPFLYIGNDVFHFVQVDTNRLRWCTMIDQQIAYASTREILDEFGRLVNEDFSIHKTVAQYGANTSVDREEEFTSKIDKLVFQIVSYLQQHPNSITEEIKDPSTRGLGFDKSKKSKGEKKGLLNPVWIGKDYKSS